MTQTTSSTLYSMTNTQLEPLFQTYTEDNIIKPEEITNYYNGNGIVQYCILLLIKSYFKRYMPELKYYAPESELFHGMGYLWVDIPINKQFFMVEKRILNNWDRYLNKKEIPHTIIKDHNSIKYIIKAW